MLCYTKVIFKIQFLIKIVIFNSYIIYGKNQFTQLIQTLNRKLFKKKMLTIPITYYIMLYRILINLKVRSSS